MYGEEGYKLAKQVGFPERIQQAADILVDIYEKSGRGSDALRMFRIYDKMDDSLNGVQAQKAMLNQLAKNEYEKKKAVDDAEHEKELAIEKAKKKRQQLVSML